MPDNAFEMRGLCGAAHLVVSSFEKTKKAKAVFSTRIGGVSGGCFASLNLGLSRGDDRRNVRENFRLFCGAAGIDIKRLVLTAQTHTANVLPVTAQDCGRGLFSDGFTDVDGLVTDEPGVFLTAFFADCVPLYFLDPVKGVCGIAHAGWRGTAARIAENTVSLMTKQYFCNPKDILAAIGPSVCAAHYEVSEETAGLIAGGAGFDGAVYEKDGRWHADLKKANAAVLSRCGLAVENIAVTDECTVCDAGRYYSHRRQGGKRGSLCAVIGLI